MPLYIYDKLPSMKASVKIPSVPLEISAVVIYAGCENWC